MIKKIIIFGLPLLPAYLCLSWMRSHARVLPVSSGWAVAMYSWAFILGIGIVSQIKYLREPEPLNRKEWDEHHQDFIDLCDGWLIIIVLGLALFAAAYTRIWR
jgi:hypothetical protein